MELVASFANRSDLLEAGERINWLRVLGTAELAQIDQRVCQQLHAIMPLLYTFKSEQQPFELICPRKGALDAHPQCMVVYREQGDAGDYGSTPVQWPGSFTCHSNPEKLPYACQTSARHVQR